MLEQTYAIPNLPLAVDLETHAIMKALNGASRALAQFNGESNTIPNRGILINTLLLQEAHASSEIENIVTTQDELFQVEALPGDKISPEAKETIRHRDALSHGFEKMQKNNGNIPNNLLIDMFEILKEQQDGFRKTPGTLLRHDNTGEVIYVPPQHPDEIIKHMRAFEAFVNHDLDENDDLDPLIRMAVIHHQFESIHPFSDGNGRIGRIINVLYLTRTGLLDAPILYMSRAIIRRKSEYYRLLQTVRDDGAWEEWIIFMLDCVAESAKDARKLMQEIATLMQDFEIQMRTNLPKIYSQDLLNNLFRHPYTRIEYVEKDLNISRLTASRYLRALAKHNFVHEVKSGVNKYYINTELVKLFKKPNDISQ